MFTYHDASTAVLLDLRRRFKAVGDLFHALIRDGITLARSLELTALLDGILRIGPVHPHNPDWLALSFIMSVGGSRMGIWSWMRRMIFWLLRSIG